MSAKIAVATVVVLAALTGEASAQALSRPEWCRHSSLQLRNFDYRVAAHGRVSHDEMRIANALQADLAVSCPVRKWRVRRVKHRLR